MMRKILSVSLINLLIVTNMLAADKKEKDYEKEREIEKAIFMAAGVEDRVLRIGLVDCLAYALKNNSEILITRLEPKIKEDEVRIAKANFEPAFSFTPTLRDNSEPSSSTLGGADLSKTRDLDFNAGISGKLVTGTEYDLDFLNEKYKSNSKYQTTNPYYTTEPKITITQPLFRDLGILVNTADIIIARNNQAQSEENFKDMVMTTITKTKVAYYNYIYYLENYAIAKSSLERARELLEINKARYAKGLASSVDVLEAESAAAQREKTLISAEASLKKAEDELKLVTNLVDDPAVWNARLELIDGKPEFKAEKIDLLESLKNAFSYRPDYLSQKIDLKNKDIKIATAKNALFPTVDLVGSFGLNGLGREYRKALEDIREDYKDWSVGVTVSIPWGGEERAKYDQKKLEKAKALMTFKRLEQNIILEVRDKVREVEIQMRQVAAARLLKEKENQNYLAQQERYAAGQVSMHDMLDYQEKLAQAELDYMKSLIDYNIAISNLDKSQGLTLAKNNVKLEEP